MRIGVLDLLCDDINRPLFLYPHDLFITKQYAGMMSQVVSVWCRRMGHKVHYATWYGIGRPEKRLPQDLDIVFISCFSRGSGLAYALATLFKLKNPGILTVLGGPHAKQFSQDAIRFFDVVVQDCDETLIREIITDFPKGRIVTTHRPLKALPGIEERMPEIKTSVFWNCKPGPFVFIPVMSSRGCPHSCDFCVDWNTPYHLFPMEQLKQDLTFVAKHFPQIRINFYDPNFGVQFDRVMTVIERINHPRKRWFLTEGSLDSLTPARLKRLEKAGCLCVIPGIESWSAYSKKAGLKNTGSAWDKLERVVEKFRLIHRHIPITQANLLFGLDTDKGDEPVELNKLFIEKTPWVSHSLNIPAPFGQTPLFKRYLKKGRILETLPFTFYCKPFLATTLKHYTPIEFYEKLIDIFSWMTAFPIMARGIRQSKSFTHKAYQPVCSLSLKRSVREMKQILTLLKTDRHFRRFHDGKTSVLPEFYHRQYEKRLGRFKELISRTDRIPKLVPDTQPKTIISNRKCA